MKYAIAIAAALLAGAARADCPPVEFAEADTYALKELCALSGDSREQWSKILWGGVKEHREAIIAGRKPDSTPIEVAARVCSANQALAQRLIDKKYALAGRARTECLINRPLTEPELKRMEEAAARAASSAGP